jgi:Asp-tRNA(Asn)/Glu-tRNA(Gln) amidotransferase A subunit family amidase
MTSFPTAREIVAAIRSRETTCVQMVERYLERIRLRNPSLNAIVTRRGSGAATCDGG